MARRMLDRVLCVRQLAEPGRRFAIDSPRLRDCQAFPFRLTLQGTRARAAHRGWDRSQGKYKKIKKNEDE